LQPIVASAEFRAGAQKGYWGLPGTDVLPEQPKWPLRILWVVAAVRAGTPTRFYLQLGPRGLSDGTSHRNLLGPGHQRTILEVTKRPKGRDGSRFAKVFRTDWEAGRAFYHPYDRVAAKGHNKWVAEQPSLIWDSNHTIVDYLEEIHSLFNSGDYLGL
jgi:hypothetical protein